MGTGGSDRSHQRAMLREIIQLMDIRRNFGLLDPASVQRSVAIVADGSRHPAAISEAARGAWTLRIWRQARIEGSETGPLGPAVNHALGQLVRSPWFDAWTWWEQPPSASPVFCGRWNGATTSGGASSSRCCQPWGGGTLRDLLVGGMRSPPFIFRDGTYLAVVMGVLVVGSTLAVCLGRQATQRTWFQRVLNLCDDVGLATFTIIGAQVALEARLDWWWMPICAALTCAGGGTLLDVVTGREPRTFQGEPYEEIAILGSLVLLAGLMIADRFETLQWPVPAAMVASWWFVMISRDLVISSGLRSWGPGRAAASTAPASTAVDGGDDGQQDRHPDG